MAADLAQLQARYGSRYPLWLLSLLMLGSMALVLASTSINVALPAIMDDFAIGRPLAQWLSTGFLAAMTAGLLLANWTQQRLGTRLTVLLGLGLFMLSSLLALAADQAWQLIALRIAQGGCAGIVQPLAMVLIFRVYAAGGRGMALGIYGLGVMIAPTLGPTIGGYLVDHFSWPAVFWMPLPLCILAMLGAIWLLPDERNPQPSRLDYWAFAWLLMALFAALGSLAEAQRFGWSEPRAWVPGLLAVLATWRFIRRSRYSEQPLLPLMLWQSAAFRQASWVALVLGLGLYGSTYLIPLFLQTVEGYSAGRAGLLLLPAGVALGLASFAGGWLSDRFPLAWLLCAGLLLFAISALGFAVWGSPAGFVWLCLLACLGRLGFGLLLPALNAAALDALPEQHLASAAGVITFVRQLGGAFGVNLLTYFLEWRHGVLGGSASAEAAAFAQTFWVMALCFILTLWPAWCLRSRHAVSP